MSSEQGGCASSSAVARATGLRIGLKKHVNGIRRAAWYLKNLSWWANKRGHILVPFASWR